MPIEIRELHIRVSVTTPAAANPSPGSSSPGQGGEDARGNNKEEIIASCVEKVMEILQTKTER